MNSEFEGLSWRALRLIKIMNIDTLAELSRVSEEKMMQHKGFNYRTAFEIKLFLQEKYYNQ
jgi:DNA-directed RNA polymerase alpha subunit